MKKYITLAALFAAGSALANADSLTLTSPSDAKLEGQNAYVAWEGTESILESWSLSFKLLDDALADNQAVFSTTRQGGGGATGYVLKTQADGGIALGETSLVIENVLSAEVKSDTITLSFVADVLVDGTFKGGQFSLTYGSTTVTEKVSGLDGCPEAINGATAMINGEQTGFDEDTWSSRFWTNGGNEKIYDISVQKLSSNVIPEPSAFGLLAGLGALALVGSRRRRR